MTSWWLICLVLDENLKPWLIEVNRSPSMSTDNPILEKMIPEMIENIVKVTVDHKLNGQELSDDTKFRLLTPDYDVIMSHCNDESQLEEDIDEELSKIMNNEDDLSQESQTETDTTSQSSNYISANENIEKNDLNTVDDQNEDGDEDEDNDKDNCLKIFSSLEQLNDNSLMKALLT